MFTRLEGRKVAEFRTDSVLQPGILKFSDMAGRAPGLAVILVGADPASQIYVRNKLKACQQVGITSFHHELPASASEVEVRDLIRQLNVDDQVDGILLQLPVPKHINAEALTDLISPEKDADGLTTASLGALFAGRPRVAPCTPWGVMKMLEFFQLEVAGKNAVVIGRSNIVGKPMAQLLLQANATVTICHTKTRDLHKHTRLADIVVVAAGQPRFVGKEAFQPQAVVIDVGIHRPTAGPFAGKICGDVKFEEMENYVRAATPVPGGVGPLTIQMLLENTVTLAHLRKGK